jgi:hypothetical protein
MEGGKARVFLARDLEEVFAVFFFFPFAEEDRFLVALEVEARLFLEEASVDLFFLEILEEVAIHPALSLFVVVHFALRFGARMYNTDLPDVKND